MPAFPLSLGGWTLARKQEGMEVGKRKRVGKMSDQEKESWSLEWSVAEDVHSKWPQPHLLGSLPRISQAEGALWCSGGCPTIRCVYIPPKLLTISHEYKNNQASKLVCASWVVSLNISSNMPIILSINRLKIHGNPKGAGSRKLYKALRKAANFWLS